MAQRSPPHPAKTISFNLTQTFQFYLSGINRTKCNLDPSKGDINDPCDSIHSAVCRGSHCACPAGTYEDKVLDQCKPGEAPRTSSGTQNTRGGFDDLGLPLDYEPNKPAPAPAPNPASRPTPPTQPRPQPGYDSNRPGGYNPNQPGYNPNQPGYNPNQPGYNPNQPGYNPNQPGYNPNQPGYNPNRPGTHGKKGKDGVGEEVGGGVGGVIFLLIIGGLIYFCCCRGGKHKQVVNRFQGLPFMRSNQQAVPGDAVPIQGTIVQQDPNFSSQHTYLPPDAQVPSGQYMPPGQYPHPGQNPPQGGAYPPAPYGAQPGFAPYPPPGGGPPMQPYPPQPLPPGGAPYLATAAPQGYPAEGQQPPPYTQQYQPNAPPPQ